jgi:hypothetical protein
MPTPASGTTQPTPFSPTSGTAVPLEPEARDARIETLRVDLRRIIDEIVKAGGDRVATLKSSFDKGWEEFTALVDKLH